VIRTVLVAVGVGLVVGGLAPTPGRASLYQPDDPMAVPVRPDGTGDPFPFDEFKRRLVLLNNILNPTLTNADGTTTDRQRLVDRVRSKQQARPLPADEAAALAADMLRLGNTDAGFFVNDALNLLTPRTRDRNPNYFVHTTLAQVHAARGEWAEAVTYHDAALIDSEMPAKVKGWTDAQRDWIAALDRDVVPHYLRIRKAEAETRPRPDPEDETPTPLFPIPERGRPADPVRFVNEAGVYEPGTLAAAERAKLPPDAIAVVQQLLLWFPTDTRLYWLLAELYAADGKLDEAQKILDECAWSRQYGNRKRLMDHRAALAAAVEERRRADEQAAADAFPISLRTVLIYFGVVAAVAVFAVVRALGKRAGRGDCGPVG
jgi:tetratricopeptide (TPR) repeat protein